MFCYYLREESIFANLKLLKHKFCKIYFYECKVQTTFVEFTIANDRCFEFREIDSQNTCHQPCLQLPEKCYPFFYHH